MILITGDVHGDVKRFSDKALKRLKKGDFLIVCGDLGLVWNGSDKEKRLLKRLGRRKYNILFVEGAHENFDELENYPTEDWNGGITRQISGNLRQLVRGHIFDLQGKKVFAFGGGSGELNGGNAPCSEETALRYESPPGDELDAAARRLEQAGNEVDIVVSYEPPITMAEFLDQSVSATDMVGIFLDKTREKIKFRVWFFGKHHLNKKIPPRFIAVFDSVIDAETLK